ncbi:piggyBac transposable element-derived protein 4-like [Vespula squamosa]|uniref:PiggyBac transposable element-derived protein 4-like n=1 Tax=Vespula squamosa TaxID=30214 RepID=A0ABD2BD37_VESSQ
MPCGKFAESQIFCIEDLKNEIRIETNNYLQEKSNNPATQLQFISGYLDYINSRFLNYFILDE